MQEEVGRGICRQVWARGCALRPPCDSAISCSRPTVIVDASARQRRARRCICRQCRLCVNLGPGVASKSFGRVWRRFARQNALGCLRSKDIDRCALELAQMVLWLSTKFRSSVGHISNLPRAGLNPSGGARGRARAAAPPRRVAQPRRASCTVALRSAAGRSHTGSSRHTSQNLAGFPPSPRLNFGPPVCAGDRPIVLTFPRRDEPAALRPGLHASRGGLPALHGRP